MYKDKKYRVRSIEEIFEDIDAAAAHHGDIEKVFLIDGDAIAIETEMLLKILKKLFDTFPSLRHVGSYVGPQSTLGKGEEDLRKLCSAGLTKAYLGVETGNDRLLKKIKKGVSAEEMLRAGQMLVESGMNLSSMVLLGLGGKSTADEEHARDTAAITNAMNPKYLAALTVTPVPGTVLYRQVEKKEFTVLDPMETLKEMKIIIENISLEKMRFVGIHASNYLPVNGMLQKDKKTMIETIDHVLATGDKRMMRDEDSRGL